MKYSDKPLSDPGGAGQPPQGLPWSSHAKKHFDRVINCPSHALYNLVKQTAMWSRTTSTPKCDQNNKQCHSAMHQTRSNTTITSTFTVRCLSFQQQTMPSNCASSMFQHHHQIHFHFQMLLPFNNKQCHSAMHQIRSNTTTTFTYTSTCYKLQML